MIYQVKDWANHFENDRSKQRKKCSFVCVPNKQHGMGFSHIMAEKDGAMVYGIWQLIIGACSQQSLPREGWLTSDGKATGRPWKAEDLALKFRRPAKEIERAFEVLSSTQVEWLIIVNTNDGEDSPCGHRVVTASSPATHLERKKEEKEEKEGSGKPTVEEMKAYCLEQGLPESDGQTLFDKWEGNGWKNDGQPIKSWQATIRSWKRQGYMPSQKKNGTNQLNFESPRNNNSNAGRADDYANYGKR